MQGTVSQSLEFTTRSGPGCGISGTLLTGPGGTLDLGTLGVLEIVGRGGFFSKGGSGCPNVGGGDVTFEVCLRTPGGVCEHVIHSPDMAIGKLKVVTELEEVGGNGVFVDLEVRGNALLREDSNGIDPVNENVVIEFDSSMLGIEETLVDFLIPAGSFEPVGSHLEFSGVRSGAPVRIKITEAVDGFRFDLKAGPILTGPFPNQLFIFLRVGGDKWGPDDDVVLTGVQSFRGNPLPTD